MSEIKKIKKDRRDLYILHSLELLAWLVVILIVVAFCSLASIKNEKDDSNIYKVFLPDVDGLIIGSPVRMMGIEVGHVIKIKPVNEEVYVKFLITNPSVEIPQGTSVTVEFSGMAGSKSLELYIPDEDTYIDKTTPMLSVNPPKRLHDSLGLLNEMYKKLTSIIYNSSAFSTKLHDALPKTNVVNRKNGASIQEFIIYSDNYLDNSITQSEKLRKNIEGLRKHER